MGRILSEIDRGRSYGRDSIIAAVLDWITGEGFRETFLRYGLDQFDSAHAYRNRHILELTRGLKGLVGGS